MSGMTAIRSEEELCNLFNIVCQASDTSSPSAALQLEIALGKSRDIFLQLLDNPSKNEAHRKEVQSGKTIINGTTFRINEEFINETIYLSNELDIDEYEASRLLLEGTKKARLVNSTPLDTAVTIYHTERSYILTTMCVILENAKDRTVNDQIQSISYHYMADIITNKIDNSPTFIKKILTTSTKLNNMIKSLSKKGTLNTTNPGNNSTTPAINTTTSGNNLNTPANNLPSSNNNQPQPTTKFSEDVLTLRIDKLKEERIYLIQLLYHLSSSFWLLEEDILDIIDLNQTVNLADSISPYLVTTLLAIISPNSIHKTEHQPGVSFIHKETLLSNIHKRITDKEWSVPTMKATVLLQWVTFIKALSNHQHKNILSLDEEARMELVMSSIRLDAFQFMNTYLLYFKQKRHTKKHVVKKYNPGDSDMVIDGFTVDHSDYKNFNADIHYDFQKYIIHELEAWSMSFIGNMSSLLRKLKYNEEDTLVSNQSPHSSNIAYVNENPTANNDLENFLTLLASIFRERLDSGLSFWIQDGGLFSFVKWLLEVKIAGTLRASFDFLGSIATGTVCATHAYSFFSTGTNHNDIFASHLFSWGKLFAGLQFYIGLYNEHKSDNSSPMLPAAEEESLCKFIYFCQQVVQYSDEAREELWTSKLFKTPESIMGMICCPTFGSLRVALFDLLAAFCSNWGGGVNSVGFNIAHDVWRMLEKSDFIIPVKVMVRGTGMKDIAGQQTLINGTTSTKTLLSDTLPVDQKDIMHLIGQPKGFLVTYESEKKARIYPETLSFVNLIASLIHTTSKREELISGFSYSAPSIPARLGEESHRSPGTAPYISVIVDHIFLDLKNQKFAFIEDKWQLVDACLHVMENSVNSFNLEPFCEYFSRSSQPETIVTSYTSALQGQGQTVQRSSDISKELISYITHPGFDIIVRVLSDSGLTRELFEIIKRGRFGVLDDSTTKAEKNPYFKNSLARCLRIFSRILSIQNAFVNLLLPYINQTAVSYSTYEYKLEQYVFPNPPSLESLSRLFLYNSSVIIELALLVNCNEHEEIYDLSASLLNDLSSNPEEGIHKYQVAKHINQAMGGLGAQLSGVLFSSTNADLIISSFSERLGINSEEVFTYDDYEYDINTIPFWLAKNTLHNVYQLNDDRQKHYTLSIRIAILDLLLKNIRKEVKSPTVTEFLLGYDINELEKTSVQRKPLSGDEQNPRLACFYLIINLLRTGIEEADDSINNISLIKSNPVLAEKCYELIFRLCSRESTTTPTLQYLRNDETFLYSQLKYISCRLEDQLSVTEPYFEGTLISTDGGRFSTDFLTLRANLNQRAWLMKSIALELHKGIRNRQGASVSKILELLYGHAQGDGDERTHSDNGLIYQMEKLNMSYGSGYQQPLWNMLEIMNSLEFTWSDGLGEACCKFELKYFTEFSPAKFETVNYQYDGEAKAYKLFDIRNVYKYLREWEIRMLRTTGVSTEDRIQLETEMGSILKGLMAENRHREIAAARLHCLRAWKQIIQVTLTDCFDLFHFELRETITYDLLSMLLPKLEQPNRLQPDLLKGLSEVILTLLTRLREDKHRQSILKVPAGDAFPAESSLPDEKLRFVFHGILNVILKDKCDISLRSDMYTALVNFVQYISPSPVSHSKDRFPSRNIQEQIVDLITSGYESKLLTRVCNDASEGQGLFKTTAFMALESIYVLYGDRRNMSIHQHFLKNNFLQYTINMIRRCDDGLINTFEKRDASLIPLYIYEAKMSLFMQMALKKEGASLLLHNGLFETLALCKFINAKPATEDQFKEAQLNHERLLIPTLELVDTMLRVLGNIQGIGIKKFSTWIKRQDILLYILSDKMPLTLSSLHLLKLTTNLFYQMSCHPSYFNDISKNGLETFHLAMLHVIAKYCLPKGWALTVQPITEQEEKWSEQSVYETVNNAKRGSVLIAKADKYITDIRKNILAYALNATFTYNREGVESFKPIFAHTLVSIKGHDISTLRDASSKTPSLSTLVATISQNGKLLKSAITDYNILSSQKNNEASLKYDEIREIVNTAIPANLGIKYDDLNPTQQHQLLATEVESRRKLKLKQLHDLLFIIQNALFVLWRHLVFYIQSDPINTTSLLSPCDKNALEPVVLFQQALFQTSLKIKHELKLSCKSIIEPSLNMLESLDLSSISSSFHGDCDRIRKCYE